MVQPLEPLTLRQGHVNELGVHPLDVGEHEKLFDGGVIAHVAIQFRIGLAPLLGRLAKEGDIEKIGFARVGNRGLRECDLRRNEVDLDGVGVDTVVEL